MKRLRSFIGGVLAGISIAIGGTVFLSLENKVLGALFFTVGLFAVCTFGFNLFTGKVCSVFDQDRSYALDLPLIWLGNLAGAFLTAAAEWATRIGPALAEKAQAICQVKLDDGPVSIFFLSVLCLPIGASIVPSVSLKAPAATASYSRVKLCALICSARWRCALSFFATISRPLVSLSMRWTIPGRITPFMPERLSPQ